MRLKFQVSVIVLFLVISSGTGCMKAPLDYSSPEKVVQTFTNALKFGTYTVLPQVATEDLKTKLDSMTEEGLESEFKIFKNAHFSHSKKEFNDTRNASYKINVQATLEGDQGKMRLLFYTVRKDDKYLIYKLEQFPQTK